MFICVFSVFGLVNKTSTEASLAPGIDQLNSTNSWQGVHKVDKVQSKGETKAQQRLRLHPSMILSEQFWIFFVWQWLVWHFFRFSKPDIVLSNNPPKLTSILSNYLLCKMGLGQAEQNCTHFLPTQTTSYHQLFVLYCTEGRSENCIFYDRNYPEYFWPKGGSEIFSRGHPQS